MAKAERLARLDEARIELETAYRAALLAALRVTAAGRWGLFGHQNDKATVAKAAPTIAALMEIGEDIAAMRATLGIEEYSLHAEFVASRGPVRAHAPGEPKQAQAWLERLDAVVAQQAAGNTGTVT